MPTRLRLVVPQALVGWRSGIWHVANVDDELVPVGRADANREPHWRTGLVECGPEDLEDSDAAVLGQVEELSFDRVRRPHSDPVTIRHLPQAKGLGQVTHRAGLDIDGLDELARPLQHETHRVERGLQRPGSVVDMPLLGSADTLGTLGDPQRAGYLGGSLLNLDHRDRARGDPPLDPVWLVPGGPAILGGEGDVAPRSPRVARQRGDVRVDLRYHE